MKDYLKKLIASKNEQMSEMRKRSDASESIEEVRAIGETLATLKKEIADAEAQLAKLDEEKPNEEKPNEDAPNEDAPEGEEGRSARGPIGGFRPMATYCATEKRSNIDMSDATNSDEYRAAFMDFVMNGKRAAILDEARDDASATTTDVGTVIPTVLVDKIIEKAESTGMILPLVTKTQYAAGVEIPTSSLKPTASWVNEGASSDRQKKTTSSIVFTHHKLRCEVSVSMEVGTMAISAFEAKLVENVAEAMVKAKEQAIISGSGSGQPTGILSVTPETGQAIALTSGTALSYELMCNAEAALPQAYEMNAVWAMTKKTFYAFQSIVDDAGQPIARVNYGIGGAAERSILGRPVVLVGDYMSNYVATPADDTVFAFLFDFSDYCLNSIYDMGISKKQDWDTEDLLTKAVTACDGKVADKNSLVTLTINAATA